ncbi:MAG: ABC transporter permease [Lachnospiraceae bacterium]|nr:ABC transporter permease [Lachnospiraceae bacterium]
MNDELMNLDDLGMSEEELFSPLAHDSIDSEKITAPRYSYWKSVFRVFFRNKLNIIALLILAFILVFAYVYPAVTNYDPMENIMESGSKHLSPKDAIAKFGFSIHNILGTGASGQSTFDAVWYGARISLSLAFICAAINMFIGILLGAVWGFSKKVDMFMVMVYQIIANVPSILVMSVMVMLFTASFKTMVFAMTVTGWLGLAYFIRTQVLIIRDREYNVASRCLGTPLLRLTVKNILPFMTSVIMLLLAEEVPSYISYEVFLTYIGFGMGTKTISLGRLIEMTQSSMLVPGWKIEFWSPVIIASVITLVLYLVGQNLGDASDPRTHM